MKKLILTLLVGLGLMFIGCSSGGGSSSNTTVVEETNTTVAEETNTTVVIPNSIPVVTDANISVAVMEYATLSVNLLANVSDSDVDASLSIVSVVQVDGNTTLPTGYTLTESNLTIDASSFDVADGVNLVYDLNVTVTDSEANVSYIINSMIQDSANDAILTTTSITGDTEVISGNDLNISLTVSDNDTIFSVSYDVYETSDTTYTISLDSGVLSNPNDNNYTALVNASGLSDGNYTIVVNAIGVIGGETPNSEANEIHNFIVYSNAPTVVTAPSLDSKTDTTINTTIGTFTDSDGVRNITVSLYYDSSLVNLVSSSTDGDFSSLTADTNYYAVTTGEALNAETNIWESKNSSTLTITTELTPDGSTTTTAPTLDSKTHDTINSTIGTFTDSDGVRNITVEIYSDSELINLVASASNGDFTSLNASTTYYLVTFGEAFNATTSVWEEKRSSSLVVTTEAISTPVIDTIPTQNVNDNGGGLATTLLTVSGTGINAGAVFSIVADPTAGGLTINSSTGVLIYDDDVGTNQTFTITIKVTNTDGGSDTETFTLNVTDNA